MAKVLTEQEISSLYAWIDELPLSRPKKNMNRDFSDGVAAAEVIHHYIPKLVELHNYPQANSISQKLYNWNTLNQKALRKIGYTVPDEIISNIVNSKPGYIESVLFILKPKIEKYLLKAKKTSPSPPVTIENYNRPFELPGLPKKQEEARYISVQPLPQQQIVYQQAPQQQMVFQPQPNYYPQQQPQMYGQQQQQRDADIIGELRETVDVLQLKVTKLEQLLNLKDKRIHELMVLLRNR